MDWSRRRRRMVDRYIRARGVEDERVLQIMSELPRHLFVEEAFQDRAYGEDALPIGQSQTISRPYIVAKMTELLDVRRDDKVLEIGTGSGYQAGVLSRLAQVVYTVERIPELSRRAAEILRSLGLQNVFYRISDGSVGWPESGPFNKILVTAGALKIPEELLEQLDPEAGQMVVPVSSGEKQVVVRIRMNDGQVEREEIEPCEFVPLIRGN